MQPHALQFVSTSLGQESRHVQNFHPSSSKFKGTRQVKKAARASEVVAFIHVSLVLPSLPHAATVVIIVIIIIVIIIIIIISKLLPRLRQILRKNSGRQRCKERAKVCERVAQRSIGASGCLMVRV